MDLDYLTMQKLIFFFGSIAVAVVFGVLAYRRPHPGLVFVAIAGLLAAAFGVMCIR